MTEAENARYALIIIAIGFTIGTLQDLWRSARSTQFKIGWTIAMFALPVLGAFTYCLWYMIGKRETT